MSTELYRSQVTLAVITTAVTTSKKLEENVNVAQNSEEMDNPIPAFATIKNQLVRTFLV